MNSNLKLALLIMKESKQQYCINAFTFAIGRGAGNNILIARDALVSRQHAVFLHINGKNYLQDIGSRNGTLLNGKKIQCFLMIELHSGDEICIGATRFSFTDLSKEYYSSNNRNVPDTFPLDTVSKPELVVLH